MLLNLIFLFGVPLGSMSAPDCSNQAYDRCVRIADPLIREARLVFPDNSNDIDVVCRTWNRFVDCLKSYTDNCFSDQQRRIFNKAVERPIESVHEMCMMPSYQQEYLEYAPCIKSTITEIAHCGPQYNLLVEQVSQGDIISKSTLCCSHDRFKQCVQAETRHLCDRGVPDGKASRFANHLIDKALSFLQDQCINYIPNSGDCTATTTDHSQFSDPVMISTSSSELYRWNTNTNTAREASAKEIHPSRMTPPRATATTTTWLPSSSNTNNPSTSINNRQSFAGSSSPLPLPGSPNLNEMYNTPPQVSTTQVLGSRRRPVSFGRASSWTEAPVESNTVRMYPETSSMNPNNRNQEQYATVSSWNVMGAKPVDRTSMGERNFGRTISSTERTTWYPAAGSQTHNQVEEPNQQSWTGRGNDSGIVYSSLAVTVTSILVSLLTVFW